MSIIRCPHCGTANRAGSNFCNGCGTDLREGESRGPTGPDAHTDPHPARDLDHTDDAYRNDTYRDDTYRDDAYRDEDDDRQNEDGRDESAQDESARYEADDYRAAYTEQADDAAFDAETEPPDRPDDAALGQAPEPVPDLGDQPWLWLEFDAEDDTASDAGFSDEEADEGGEFPHPSRLIAGVQGLLNPIRISTNISDDDEPTPAPQATPPIGLAPESLRIVRGLMAEPPPIRNVYTDHPEPVRKLRIPWIFALVGLAVGLPALLMFVGPGGMPHQWPGVVAAYRTIQAVPPDTLVVVYWAYDPATAGELDLLMRPVARHLLERRVRLAIVSTLPGGPATARRLIARVRTSDRPGDLATAASLAQPVTYTYIPGGAAVLPLLAREPAQGLIEAPYRADPALALLLTRQPRLVVVAAAQAEDVQDWLEQVQPLTGTPVVAVTAAGADPILRPYLDSGQLLGLVSGFDGAYHYRRLLDPFTAPADNERLLHQVAWQNWGHLAFLAAILLGNLAALLGRETLE